MRAVKRNPGCDATIAESGDNVGFGSASKAGFGQPSRQFAEELFIHSATIQKSMPRPRHISNSWLCMTWLNLGDSKAEGLPSIQRWRAKGCDRFLRGAEATVVGAVGGREIIRVRRFAGEE
jgi:hypothetical protein